MRVVISPQLRQPWWLVVAGPQWRQPWCLAVPEQQWIQPWNYMVACQPWGQPAMGFPRLPWHSQGVQMRRGAAYQACPLQGDRRPSNQARGHKKLVLGMISTRISGIPTNPFAIGVLGKPWPVPTNGARLKPNAASKSPKAKPPQPQALKPPHSYRQMPGL